MDWHASWIWLPPQRNMDNLFVLARREVQLTEIPAQVMARVSGSQLYQLFVNGTRVGRGPNPADPSYYYYDTHDIARWLRPGANVIALIGHGFSVESKGAICQNWGRGGLLFEAEVGTVRIATDGSWRVLQAPQWDQDAPVNCNLYHDFKEYIDTRREPTGWLAPGFDDRAWLKPEVIGVPPVAPWTRLLPREIPPLGGEVVRPVAAYWESASVTYAWRQDWEVYHEQRLVVDGEQPAGKWTEVTKTHPDYTPSILLDFGTLVTGYLRITVHDSVGGVIECCYGESLFLTRVDRFILRGGEQVLEPYQRRTFRYLKLLFPETPRRIDLDRVELTMDTYPVQPVGQFQSSDERLNRIHAVACHTIRLSMLDHFVDCPWRERTIYGGDVYVENPIAYYAFGDPRLNRKTLRQMFALQFPQGALPPYGPYAGVRQFYPAWSAYFGLALIDDWHLTGDRAFCDELWPNLVRLCDWTLTSAAKNRLPLIGHPGPGKGGDLAAYEAAEKTGFAAWEVFPFQALLARAAALAHARGAQAEATRWGEAAERMAEAIRSHCIDPATGLAGPSPRAASHRYHQNDSTLLLWSAVTPPPQRPLLIQSLCTPGAATPVDCPFNGFFLLDGLFRAGATREALAFLRQYWGAMLDRGATTFWEHFSLDARPTLGHGRLGSACHGWSAAPAYALPAFVLGVEPLEPGFARILVAPQPGDLAWARGVVPTPHGPVSVAWEASSAAFLATVTLPRAGRFRLPALGVHRVHAHVDGHPVEPVSGSVELAPGTHRIALAAG